MSDHAAITASIDAIGDWRGPVKARLRALVLEADPGVVETIKWRKPSNPDGVPTYSHDGLIGTLEHYKDKVKFTFAKGGHLQSPTNMSWTGGGVRRAIDLLQGDDIDAEAFKDLVRQAVAWNQES